jgi:hypothetical protein
MTVQILMNGKIVNELSEEEFLNGFFYKDLETAVKMYNVFWSYNVSKKIEARIKVQ